MLRGADLIDKLEAPDANIARFAIEQRAKGRVAIHSGNATPDKACMVINEARNLTIADGPKLKIALFF